MKILYKHRTRCRGVERVHILGVVRAFEKAGHKVLLSPHLVTDSGNLKKKEVYINKIITVNTPNVIYEVFALIHNFISFKNVCILLKKEKFDFIYERYGFFEFSTIFISILFKIPIVLEINGLMNRIDQTHGRKVFFKKLVCWLEKKLLSRVSIFLPVSSSLKMDLLHLNISPNKILILPNAVNIKDFDWKLTKVRPVNPAIEIPTERIVIGFVGSFNVWHKVDLLVRVFQKLIAIQNNIHLLLVGDGNERGKIEKLFCKNNLGSYVTMTGAVLHEDVSYYIHHMDIATMPHSNLFGSPVKIFEYMAMKKVVVAPKFPPIQEVIKDGFNGFLFEPENIDQFASVILKLLQSKELRDKTGENAYQTIIDNHTWDKNVEKIIKCLPVISKKFL